MSSIMLVHAGQSRNVSWLGPGPWRRLSAWNCSAASSLENAEMLHSLKHSKRVALQVDQERPVRNIRAYTHSWRGQMPAGLCGHLEISDSPQKRMLRS